MKTHPPVVDEDETLNSFYHGRILIIQKKKGYRFSVDAPLLADFVQIEPGECGLEIGAGSGVVSLLLSVRPFRRLVCLEVQEGLARLAERNIRLNHLEDRIQVIRQDLRQFRSKKKFDVVFSNPPYIKKKTGVLSPSAEKAIAKHEIKCDIFDIMHLTARLLKKDGRAYFIFPAKRLEDFSRATEESGMKIKTMRWVFPRPGTPARWFLAECDFSSEARRVLAPLIIFDEKGKYTLEMKRIFSGERSEQVLL